MSEESVRLNQARSGRRVGVSVDTRISRWSGAVALFISAMWLAVLVQHDRHHAHWQADGRLGWSLAILAGVAMIARGIFLGRPVTAAHAAAAGAAVIAGLGLHVLSFPLLGNMLIAGAGLALMWPTRASPQPEALPRVWALVDATHGDPLAPFAMHSLKSYHFSSDQRAAIAYRTQMGFAVVSGDPIGDQRRFRMLVAEFAAMCRSRGWRIVVLGCSEHRLPLWGDPGVIGQSLRAVPFGRDVVIDVAHFTMAGRASRNLRQAVQRTHNGGITTEVVAERDLDESQLAELTEVLYASHRKARTERGFSMILDGALQGRYPGVQIIMARGPDGRVQGFHRYATAGGGNDVSLDVPWRRPGAPNGVDERLSVDMISWSKDHGARRLSLAFAAFPEIFDAEQRGTLQSVFYVLIHLGDGFIRLESLYRYLRKYHSLKDRRYALLSMHHLLPALLVMLTLEFSPRRRHLQRSPSGTNRPQQTPRVRAEAAWSQAADHAP
jgi:lysylphosphatidylglycerol synthetase-like protein (DUF2156 family)